MSRQRILHRKSISVILNTISELWLDLKFGLTDHIYREYHCLLEGLRKLPISEKVRVNITSFVPLNVIKTTFQRLTTLITHLNLLHISNLFPRPRKR